MLAAGGNRRFDPLSSMCGNALGIEEDHGHWRRSYEDKPIRPAAVGCLETGSCDIL